MPTHRVFTKTLDYVKRFNRYKNKTAVKEVRSYVIPSEHHCRTLTHDLPRVLTRKGLEEYEIASLANLAPENAEEAKTLIPSLKHKFTDEELDGVLNDLRNYSTF